MHCIRRRRADFHAFTHFDNSTHFHQALRALGYNSWRRAATSTIPLFLSFPRLVVLYFWQPNSELVPGIQSRVKSQNSTERGKLIVLKPFFKVRIKNTGAHVSPVLTIPRPAANFTHFSTRKGGSKKWSEWRRLSRFNQAVEIAEEFFSPRDSVPPSKKVRKPCTRTSCQDCKPMKAKIIHLKD